MHLSLRHAAQVALLNHHFQGLNFVRTLKTVADLASRLEETVEIGHRACEDGPAGACTADNHPARRARLNHTCSG